MTARSCAYCGAPIPWVSASGTRVKPSEHAKRKYCSMHCAGLASPRPPTGLAPGGSKPRPDSTKERFVQLLEQYGGLPLTADDVAEELAVTRGTVQDVAGKLVREGRITRDRAEDKRTALYRAVGVGEVAA